MNMNTFKMYELWQHGPFCKNISDIWLYYVRLLIGCTVHEIFEFLVVGNKDSDNILNYLRTIFCSK